MYGFRREDIARQLKQFAEKDLIANYPTGEVNAPNLGEFTQGRQTAADPELYFFYSIEDIPAAIQLPADDNQYDYKWEAGRSEAPQDVYKPRIRGEGAGFGTNDKQVDILRIKTYDDIARDDYGSAKYFVYNPWPFPIRAKELGVCALVGGVLFALQRPDPRRIRFRLKTEFNDQGYAQAKVLDAWGDSTLCYAQDTSFFPDSTVIVTDPRKLFAHSVGSDSLITIQEANPNLDDMLHAGGSVGYAIETYQLKDCDPENPFDCVETCGEGSYCYPRFEVEQCTQEVNRMRVQIDKYSAFPRGARETSGSGYNETKDLLVYPNQAFASQWPYVDFPKDLTVNTEDPENPEYRITAHNVNRFSAIEGWAIIERVDYPSRLQNAENRCVPYSGGLGTRDKEWHIVAVENPIARYICVRFDGSGGWFYDGTFFEGEDPTSYFNDPEASEPGSIHDSIEVPPCLQLDCLGAAEKGLAYWDPNVQKYFVFSTNSALYGSAKDFEAVGKFAGSQSCEGPLIGFEGCDAKFKVTSGLKIFGDKDPLCPSLCTEQTASQTFGTTDVLTNVSRSYVCMFDDGVDPTITDEAQCILEGGSWELSEEICFDKKVIYTCDVEDTADVCVNICCDEPPPPVPDPCFPCEHCLEDTVKFQNFVLAWSNVDDGTGQVFGGRATNAVFEELAFSEGCCSRLTCTLESDNPAIAPTTVTATVCIEIAGGGFCNLSTLKVTFAWSQASYAGVTLPTEMCGGLLAGCVGDYGLSGGAGVNPNNPSPLGGTWDEAGIAVVGC